MKRIEIILVIMTFLAILAKLFHLPGSSILTVFSFSLISSLYFYFGFALFNKIRLRNIFKKESYDGISAVRIIGAIGTGIALSVSTISIVFKFQDWPGASFQLYVGFSSLLVVTAISAVKISKDQTGYYKKILLRAGVYGLMCIVLISIPTKTWLNWQYPNYPEYVNAVLEAKKNPENQELWENVEKESEKMYQDMSLGK